MKKIFYWFLLSCCWRISRQKRCLLKAKTLSLIVLTYTFFKYAAKSAEWLCMNENTFYNIYLCVFLVVYLTRNIINKYKQKLNCFYCICLNTAFQRILRAWCGEMWRSNPDNTLIDMSVLCTICISLVWRQRSWLNGTDENLKSNLFNSKNYTLLTLIGSFHEIALFNN